MSFHSSSTQNRGALDKARGRVIAQYASREEDWARHREAWEAQKALEARYQTLKRARPKSMEGAPSFTMPPPGHRHPDGPHNYLDGNTDMLPDFFDFEPPTRPQGYNYEEDHRARAQSFTMPPPGHRHPDGPHNYVDGNTDMLPEFFDFEPTKRHQQPRRRPYGQ